MLAETTAFHAVMTAAVLFSFITAVCGVILVVRSVARDRREDREMNDWNNRATWRNRHRVCDVTKAP